MKRMLMIGSSIPERIEEFYVRAFRELGWEVTLFDPEIPLRLLLSNRIAARLSWPVHHLIVHREILRLYRRPTWDLVFVVKGYQVGVDTIHECKRLQPSIPWVVLNPDSPFEKGRGATSRHIRESISAYDSYLIWSRQLVEELKAAGAQRPLYLPFAYDEQTHQPAPDSEYDPSLARTIAFAGTYDPERQAILEAIADLPLVVFGGGWDRLPASSPLRGRVTVGLAAGMKLRRLVTSSLACLNILRAQNHGAHNMRTFEVPAMRGVMLTYRSAEQQQYFPENEASLMYGSVDELRAQIERLLADPSSTRAIRARAYECSRGQSYRDRARQLEGHLRDLA